jgi:hypothetical protein
MKTAGLMLALVAILVGTAACGQVVGQLTGGAAPRTAGALWSDVPPYADLNDVVFTTDAPPADVTGFYTKQRMAGAGWNTPDNPGCSTDAGAALGDGAVCFFGRRDGGRETVLLLITTRDDSSKQTHLFYVRMSGSATPTAGSGRG